MAPASERPLQDNPPETAEQAVIRQLCTFPPEILEAALRVLRLRRDSEASMASN